MSYSDTAVQAKMTQIGEAIAKKKGELSILKKSLVQLEEICDKERVTGTEADGTLITTMETPEDPRSDTAFDNRERKRIFDIVEARVTGLV